jgi:hypothetical protein
MDGASVIAVLCTLTCALPFKHVYGLILSVADEFEGLEVSPEMPVRPLQPPVIEQTSPSTWAVPARKHFWMEIVAIAFIIIFFVNYLRGRRVNEALALRWAQEFCTNGSVLDKNFSLLGPGHGKPEEQMLMKQSQDQFEVWASGRRCALSS